MKVSWQVFRLLSVFFRRRYPEETELNLQAWLVNNGLFREKEYALNLIWEGLDNEHDDTAERSLDEVKRKTGQPAHCFEKKEQVKLYRIIPNPSLRQGWIVMFKFFHPLPYIEGDNMHDHFY